jgi:hypothetical protein
MRYLLARTRERVLDAVELSELFGNVETRCKSVHKAAQLRLMEMGRKFGFGVLSEYMVPDLVTTGRTSYIDVVWISQSAVLAAFEIRRKKKNLDIATSRKNIMKLLKLRAQERFIVNVSATTGRAYFHNVSETRNELEGSYRALLWENL